MYQTNIELLRQKLASKGKTIDDLAACIGVDRSTVYRRIENNRLRICDMQHMAEMLSLSAEEAVAIFLSE